MESGQLNTFGAAFQSVDFEGKCEEIQLSKRLRDVPFNEKVKFVYAYFDKQNKWKAVRLRSTKSTTESTDLRARGNKFFQTGRDKEALQCYSESVALALPDTVELSLAFANRSAALYRLGNYFASLQDINRSLSSQCPDSIRSKLLKRREACRNEIEQENRVKASFLYDFKCHQHEDKNGSFLQQDLQLVELKADETEPFDRLCSLPVLENENDSLPNTNAKVGIEFTSIYGYHIVCRQNIDPGEIIAHEKASSSVLDRTFRSTNCSFCFVKNVALIPCEGCSLVLYCGETCRLKAYNMYHRVECEIAALLQEASGECSFLHFLPLRTLLIGTEQGKQVESLTKDPELRSVLQTERQKIRMQADYISICNLHRDIDSLPETAVLGLCMKSSCFLHWLKHSSFFASEFSRDLTIEQAFVGTLLLNHFLTLVFNSISVTETVIPVPENKMANYTIGAGIYAFCSRFNHSCDPNADFYSNKDSVIIYSHRPIMAGEQVFISYGSHYHSMPILKRRTSLKQYGFVCQCRACKADWPLYDALPRKPTLLRNLNLTKIAMMKLYDKYENLWSADTQAHDLSEGLLRFLCEFSTVVVQNFEAPLQLQVACQSGIEKLLSIKGNFYVDCSDVGNRVRLWTEYTATKTNIDRLKNWIRDFLTSLSSRVDYSS